MPLVEKFAEHLTAIDEAHDNQVYLLPKFMLDSTWVDLFQMNFALAHVLGATLQTALLNSPLVVIVGWGLGKNMVRKCYPSSNDKFPMSLIHAPEPQLRSLPGNSFDPGDHRCRELPPRWEVELFRGRPVYNNLHPDCCHDVVLSKPFRSIPDNGRSGRSPLVKTRELCMRALYALIAISWRGSSRDWIAQIQGIAEGYGKA